MRAIPTPVPIPTGGWDATSPISAMRPDRANILRNMFPESYSIAVRPGYASHATGLPGAVDTLMAWRGQGLSRLFAASGAGIYDVTGTGAVGAAVVSGKSNARWQSVHFATAGGTFLWCCNGQDAPIHYDGTSWGTPTLGSITPTDVSNVFAAKARLWLVLLNSPLVGFLPVNSLGGTVSLLNVGTLLNRGGYIVAGGSWTQDSGAGPDDFTVFVSSAGQAIVYAGNNPASAGAWELVGVYNIGRPLGKRCVLRFGGDMLILTTMGMVNMSTAVRLDPSQVNIEQASIASPVRGAWSPVAASAFSTFGWCAAVWNEGRCIVVNVPDLLATRQFVMNTQSAAWCEYAGLPAVSWETLDGSLYWGGTGTVYKMGGMTDAGASIEFQMSTAFSLLGNPGTKHTKLLQIVARTDGSVSPALAIDTEYTVGANASQPVQYSAGGGFTWDDSDWDSEDLWSSDPVTSQRWIGASAIGRALSINLRGAVRDATYEIQGLNLLYEPGGVF